MERIVWAVRNVTSGTGVSNRAERPSLRRPQIWTAFHVNGRRWRWESVRCDSSKSSPDCPLSCRGSRKLQKFVSPDFDRKTEDASWCRKICARVIHEFLKKHETTVVHQQPSYPYLASADIFLFPKRKSSLNGRRIQTVDEIEENSIGTFAPYRKTHSRKRSRNGRNFGSGVPRVEGSTLKVTSLQVWLSCK